MFKVSSKWSLDSSSKNKSKNLKKGKNEKLKRKTKKGPSEFII